MAVCRWQEDGPHLKSAARQLGKKVPKGPEIPKAYEYLWSWWQELASARGSSGFGPAPLTRHDILAWMELEHARPNAQEVRILLGIDRAFLSEWHRLEERRQARNKT